MSFDQIHFGAGRHGVGAILPLSLSAGGRVHVVVHTASELAPDSELICSVCGPNGQRHDLVLDVASFSRANAIEQLDPQARAVLVAASELLVTTAITPGGIDAQSEFLMALARARVGKHTIFIPCEEEIGAEHTELLTRLGVLGVDVRRGVVNRLCSRDIGATGNSRRAVRADEHVEWLIEGMPEGLLLQSLAHVPGVAFTKHIEAHALRTRWLAHGIRLALALLAAEANQPQIRLQAVESARDGWLKRVYSILIPLVERRCDEFVDMDEYAHMQVETLLRHDDDGLSALRKLRRANLSPFLRELQRSVGEPCRELVQSTGALPSDLRRVFFAIEVVLSNIECYSDYERYACGDMVLTIDTDAKALDAYRELLAGIFSVEEVESRVLSVEYQLDQHREELV
jgi:hypothetical protein